MVEKGFYPSGCNPFGCFDSRNLSLSRGREEEENLLSWNLMVINFWLFTGLFLRDIDKVLQELGGNLSCVK